MPPANCNVLSLFSIKTRQVMLRDARNPAGECLNTFYVVSFPEIKYYKDPLKFHKTSPSFFARLFLSRHSISILFASFDHK